MGVRPPEATQMLTIEQLVELQVAVDDIFVHHAVQDYAVRLVMATRDPVGWRVPEIAGHVGLGASPRATLGLLAAGRALALMRGRRFLVPQDVADVAPEILRHRLILTYDALADGVTTNDVIARVLATMLVAFFLNGLVSVVGVVGGYFFNVILQGGTPGAYLASFTALAQLPDLYVGQLKAVIFGMIAALVAAYKGLNAKGGPKGVGDAVNQSVVISFMLLFLTNFIITAVYFQVVPQKGG
jgi:hypothetical protein